MSAGLQNPSPHVRIEAARALGELGPSDLARYADALARSLEDDDQGVRFAAVETLEILGIAELVRHVDALYADVRLCVVRCLAKSPSVELAGHAGALASRVHDTSSEVRLSAVETLSSLRPADMASHSATLALALGDDFREVRLAASLALGKLEPSDLALHGKALAERLCDSEMEVRMMAAKSLGRLEPRDLAEHASAIKRSFGGTLLHVFVRAGDLVQVHHLLGVHWATMLSSQTDTGDTPLHMAAQSGHLEIVEALVAAGALIRVRNKKKQTPEDLARRQGHNAVGVFLNDCVTISGLRGGTGNALAQALGDTGNVVKVEWHTMPMQGVSGTIGVKHSLLAVSVGSSEPDLREYVIEKSDPPLFPGGVYVSHWKDVRSSIRDLPLHTLQLVELSADSECSMPILIDVAVKLGPYNVSRCNCHHMALAVYNHCAKESARVARIPNEFLTSAARVLGMFGVDVARSTASGSVSRHASRSPPPMRGSGPVSKHAPVRWARDMPPSSVAV